MATHIRRIHVFSNGSYSITIPSNNLWRVRTDAEVDREDRKGMPMVFFFRETKCNITMEWQLYLCAINYGMTLQYVSALLNDGRMTNNNGDGFGRGEEKQNWITMDGIVASNPLPRWSKCWTCGDATVEMIGNQITMFDGSIPPPLRDGLFHPLTRAQALDPASYKYLPQTHRHRFFAAVTVNDDLTPRPFVNGALYPWYKDGRTPVSWLPHVTNKRDGEITYPPAQLSGNSAILVR